MNENKIITINGAFADWIDLIIFQNEQIINPTYLTKEINLYNDNSKEEIIKALNECHSFAIEDEYITFVIDKTKEELQKQKDHSASNQTYHLDRLKKSFNNKERPHYKEMILNYLLHLQTKKELDLSYIIKYIQN